MKPRMVVPAILVLSASRAFALEPWVDPLPIPPRIVVPHEQRELTIHMTQFTGKLHRDLPETTQWGFEGVSPGPTIEVDKDQPLTVHWVSDLPLQHFLKAPVDEMKPEGAPDVRTVIHLHGAVVEQPSITDKLHDNDGWPDLWLTHGEEQIAQYNNPQGARTLWYHDHSMGSTGRNVSAGLLGTYIIHDEMERSLDLPSGKYDIPLVIQPKRLKTDGTLDYVTTLTRENYGNAFFVNGKMYPYLDVEPRKYRFRILNASNARTVALKLLDFSDLVTAGPAFHQIGSDSGFLADTVQLNDPLVATDPRLVLMPAERADVIIDFSAYAGKTFILHNNAKPDDTDAVVPLYQIMQFRVGNAVSQADTSKIPDHIRDIQRLDPASAKVRRITLDDMNMNGVDMLTLNGKMWRDPVEDFPVLGSTEVWELVNTQPDSHPFHIHLVDFQVLDRRAFDLDSFNKTGVVTYTAVAESPLANEMAWKDTVRVPPGHVTRIIMRFGPFTGHYVYHCHILEHEDMDMMRPYDVVAPTAADTLVPRPMLKHAL